MTLKVLQSLQASFPHMVILFYERCLGTVVMVDVCVCVKTSKKSKEPGEHSPCGFNGPCRGYKSRPQAQ